MPPVNDKLLEGLAGEARQALERAYTARGLTIAQSICRARMPEAFDSGSQEIVLLIIKDICDTIGSLK